MTDTIKPVGDPDGVRGAFETIRDTFAKAEGVNQLTQEQFECKEKQLRAWFTKETRGYLRYRMEFKRTGAGGRSFQADVRPDEPSAQPEGARGVHGRIVLMNDRRYLAHDGHFAGVRHSTRDFYDYTNDGKWEWIEVDGKQVVLIATIEDDVRPSDLVDNLDRFLSLVQDFKDGRPTPTARPDSTLAEQSTVAVAALNTILYGPPGTGKTYLTARRCVKICEANDAESDATDETEMRRRYRRLLDSGQVEFATFHQSYGYEEFVEGLRPAPNEDGQAGFRLVPTPGILKRIADRARGDLENDYVLVIDEINRANISKVMGELITLLEEDKREGASNEVAVTLPHSGDEQKFTLPPNLHILGTMNTADRSIALIDTALRRRFQFEEVAPKPELLSVVDGVNLPAVLKTINERLEYLVDRDHLIGHAWLMNARTKADVDDIFRRKIIPLIAEYFYDDWRKVHAVLGNTDDFVRGERLTPPPGLDEEDVEERFRWTVRDDFAPDAYRRLISGQSTSPEADADA